MGHHPSLFPTDISAGSASGFGFNHGIVQLRSGAAEYISRHSDMRHVFDVSYGIKSWASMNAMKEFYAARNGLSNSFMFQDPLDMNTSSEPFIGDGGPGTVANTDEVFVASAAGTETQFQLIKTYSEGGYTHTRTILHPVEDTVTLRKWDDSATSWSNLTKTTDYSVDYDTGIVTLVAALELGDIIQGGFDFYNRVRFGPEVDRALMITAENFGTAGARAMPLFEEINSVSHIDTYPYGGGSHQAVSGIASLSYSWGFSIAISPSTATTIVMPDPTDVSLGGPYFRIRNLSDTHALTFVDGAGTTLFTVVASKSAYVDALYDGSITYWDAMGN